MFLGKEDLLLISNVKRTKPNPHSLPGQNPNPGFPQVPGKGAIFCSLAQVKVSRITDCPFPSCSVSALRILHPIPNLSPFGSFLASRIPNLNPSLPLPSFPRSFCPLAWAYTLGFELFTLLPTHRTHRHLNGPAFIFPSLLDHT